MRNVRGIFSLLWKCYVGSIFVIFALALYPLFAIILSNKKWKKTSFRLFVFWSWMMRIFCLYAVKKIKNAAIPDGPYIIISNHSSYLDIFFMHSLMPKHPFLFWSWMMRIFCLYAVKKIKNAAIPDGPYIIISNHSSYLDIFFMHSLMPKHPFLFLGKGEILGYPIIRTYFKGLNIPVHRKDRAKAAQSFVMAKKAVNEGWSLVIFPEGTIPDEGNPKMIPFKAGAFKLAKALNIPIVPMTFTNNWQLFSDPTDLLGPARPGISHVYIHPHISVEEMADLTEKELNELCFQRINAPILEEYPKLTIDD